MQQGNADKQQRLARLQNKYTISAFWRHMSDQSVRRDLAAIEQTEKDLLVLYLRQIKSGGDVSAQHFYLFGIARRTLAQSKAFRQMIEGRNSLVALSLLRLQLDTLLRLYALFFVADPADFADRVLGGTSVNKLKDARGELMRDAYLAKRVAVQNPWVTSVYHETSGFVHFSRRHILAAFNTRDDGKEDEFELFIGPEDVDKPLAYYGEPVAAFLHVMQIIPVAAEDWFSRLPRQPTV